MQFGQNYQTLFKRDVEKSRKEIAFLESILPKEGVIIDAGCGDGFHAITLSEKDYHIVGIDQSTYMINQAISKNSLVDFRQADLRTAQIPSNTCTYSLFSSFGYDDYELALANIAKSIESGGLFILDIHNSFSKVPNIPKETINFEGNLIQESFDPLSSIWTSKITYPDKSIEEFSLRFFTPTEISALLTKYSFTAEYFYGDFDKNPYTTASRRLIIVARKNL